MSGLRAFRHFIEQGGDPDDLVYDGVEAQQEALAQRVTRAAALLQHAVEVPGRRVAENIQELGNLGLAQLEPLSSELTETKEKIEAVKEQNSAFAEDLRELDTQLKALKTHQEGLHSHLQALKSAAAMPKGPTMLCDFLLETGARGIYHGSGTQPVQPPPLTAKQKDSQSLELSTQALNPCKRRGP